MSVTCIARQHIDPNVEFEVSYLKNSVWLEDNGDARVMIHCVIKPSNNSPPFSSLRLVVPENVSDLEDTSRLLLDDEHMKTYPDGDVKYEKRGGTCIICNGGEYDVTNVTFGDVKKIDGFTEILVNLTQPITPPKARGFRIEFNSMRYAKKPIWADTYPCHVKIYGSSIRDLQGLPDNNYSNADIMEIEYGDIWVISQKNKMIVPAGNYDEAKDLGLVPSGYKEWAKEDLEGRHAYRWRINKRDNPSGITLSNTLQSPLLRRITFLAIVLAAVGILVSILVAFIT